MKRTKLAIACVIFCVAILLSHAVLGKAPSGPQELSDAQEGHEAKLRTLEIQLDIRLTRLREEYIEYIDGEQERYAERGAMEHALAARREKRLFQKVGDISEIPLPAPSKLMKKNRARYDKSEGALRMKGTRLEHEHLRDYLTELTALKKQLTQESRLDDAIPVKDEEIKVARQREELAEKLKKEGIDPVIKKERKFKVLSSSKRVEASGDIQSAATTVAIRIQKGDKITIEAHGKWRPHSRARWVGPDGYSVTQARRKTDNTIVFPYGALVAWIGDGQPILVQAKKDFTAQGEGFLYLDIWTRSDEYTLRDGEGHYQATIRVKRYK